MLKAGYNDTKDMSVMSPSSDSTFLRFSPLFGTRLRFQAKDPVVERERDEAGTPSILCKIVFQIKLIFCACACKFSGVVGRFTQCSSACQSLRQRMQLSGGTSKAETRLQSAH